MPWLKIGVYVMRSSQGRPSTPVSKHLISVKHFDVSKPINQASQLNHVPNRTAGVDLKLGEQLVRRLALHQALLPTYRLPPPLPNDVSPALTALLANPSALSSLLPPPVDPAWRAHESSSDVVAPGVPPQRAARKRSQLVALLRVIAPFLLARPQANVVDFCAGCGHVGLLVAALFPAASITLVDIREVALRIAQTRAKAAGLVNVQTRQCSVDELPADVPCDIALALHACGSASDLVLSVAKQRRAAVVVAPCCVGAVASPRLQLTIVDGDVCRQSNITDTDPEPRSSELASVVTAEEFSLLARAADYSELKNGCDHWRGIAKMLVEQDRLAMLKDAGFRNVTLVKMRPEDCTPKNDMLVAWSELTWGANDNNINSNGLLNASAWCFDHLANGVLLDFCDASLLHGFGAHEVAVVERTLRDNVCDPSGPGTFSSSPGAGKRARKIIHAVAEALNLAHHSIGRGTARHVIVARNPHWPLFFDNYIGVGGPHVDQVAQSLSQFVPSEFVERRHFVRGAPHHITIVSPREVSLLPSPYTTEKSECTELCYKALFSSQFTILGIGHTRKVLRKDSDPKNDVDAEVYFAVIEWPEAQLLRQELGLPPCDLHITLGFKNKDVYGVAKDSTTLVKWLYMTCSPWIVKT